MFLHWWKLTIQKYNWWKLFLCYKTGNKKRKEYLKLILRDTKKEKEYLSTKILQLIVLTLYFNYYKNCTDIHLTLIKQLYVTHILLNTYNIYKYWIAIDLYIICYMNMLREISDNAYFLVIIRNHRFNKCDNLFQIFQIYQFFHKISTW